MNCVVLATLLAHLVSASPEQDTSSVNSGSARQLGGPQSLWEVILLPQSYFDRRYYYSNHLQHSTDSYNLPYTTTSPYLGGGISYPTLFIGSPASSLTKRQHPFTNYATFPRLTDATTARTSLATTLRPPSEAAKDLSEQSTSNLRTRKGPPSKSKSTWAKKSMKRGRTIIIDPTYDVGCLTEGFFPTTRNFRASSNDATCTQGFYWCKKDKNGMRGLRYRCPDGYAFQKKYGKARCQKLARLSGCIYHHQDDEESAVIAAP